LNQPWITGFVTILYLGECGRLYFNGQVGFSIALLWLCPSQCWTYLGNDRRYKMTDLEVDQLNRRIGSAFTVRQNVKSCWGKQYWDNVLAYLLRQANRLN
jgi:hypothetical protein